MCENSGLAEKDVFFLRRFHETVSLSDDLLERTDFFLDFHEKDSFRGDLLARMDFSRDEW